MKCRRKKNVGSEGREVIVCVVVVVVRMRELMKEQGRGNVVNFTMATQPYPALLSFAVCAIIGVKSRLTQHRYSKWHRAFCPYTTAIKEFTHLGEKGAPNCLLQIDNQFQKLGFSSCKITWATFSATFGVVVAILMTAIIWSSKFELELFLALPC